MTSSRIICCKRSSAKSLLDGLSGHRFRGLPSIGENEVALLRFAPARAAPCVLPIPYPLPESGIQCCECRNLDATRACDGCHRPVCVPCLAGGHGTCPDCLAAQMSQGESDQADDCEVACGACGDFVPPDALRPCQCPRLVCPNCEHDTDDVTCVCDICGRI